MKFFTIQFFCISFIAARCFASPDDGLNVWRERASKTEAGMSLADAETLFPPYTPVESFHYYMYGPTAPTAEVHNYYDYGPETLTLGTHEICLYWVSPSVTVQMDYQRTTSDNPLIRPVIIERRYPTLIKMFSPAPNAFSAAPFTLRNTVPRYTDTPSASL